MTVDELERRFIRAAQHELLPSAADRERTQAALLERIAAEPWGGAAGASGASGVGLGAATGPSARSLAPGFVAGVVGAMRGSRVGMLGVGLVVGAVVGGWFGFERGRELERSLGSDPPAPAAPVVAPPAPPDPARNASPPEAAPEPPAAEPPEPSPAVEVAEAASARRSGAGAGRARAARSAAATQPPSSLAAELAMLQRARRALNAENGRLALGIVEELDERFPNGVLVEERSATRILSLCQLERVAEAKQAARVFLGRYPSSVYAERVRQSCASGSAD